MLVDNPAQLAHLFSDSLFTTAESAARNADLHMSYPVTVWRLPTGQYVWATTDTQEVVTDSCGLVPLRELCIGEEKPTEIVTRDYATWDRVAWVSKRRAVSLATARRSAEREPIVRTPPAGSRHGSVEPAPAFSCRQR